eukprot:scaffold58307_cov58-Attheya_sp.AAC.2
MGPFWANNKNCFVKLLSSGDFDGDLLADQVFLYVTKMVFYFSSDRQPGVLPFDNSMVGVGAELYFPHSCEAQSIRVIDLKNDGTEEILIACDHPGEFLIYTQGNTKGDWILDNGCNDGEAFGDLNIIITHDTQKDERLYSGNTKVFLKEGLFLQQKADGNFQLYQGSPLNPSRLIWETGYDGAQSQGNTFFTALQRDGHLITRRTGDSKWFRKSGITSPSSDEHYFALAKNLSEVYVKIGTPSTPIKELRSSATFV